MALLPNQLKSGWMAVPAVPTYLKRTNGKQGTTPLLSIKLMAFFAGCCFVGLVHRDAGLSLNVHCIPKERSALRQYYEGVSEAGYGGRYAEAHWGPPRTRPIGPLKLREEITSFPAFPICTLRSCSHTHAQGLVLDTHARRI